MDKKSGRYRIVIGPVGSLHGGDATTRASLKIARRALLHRQKRQQIAGGTLWG